MLKRADKGGLDRAFAVPGQPEKKLSIVLDTDAYNEVDDQFAIAYALLSPERLDIKAIYAAPFVNDHACSAKEGMEQSFQEILHIMQLCNKSNSIPVFKGATRFLRDESDVVQSDAVDDLIHRALHFSATDPLYVVCIGAPTNIASAIKKCPSICENIVVLWLGGNSIAWKDAREFNLEQDILASQTLLRSGVNLVLFPCGGVTDTLRIAVPQLKSALRPNHLSQYLIRIVDAYQDKEFGAEKVIWDIVPFTWLIDPAWIQMDSMATPDLSDDCRWIEGAGSHTMLCAVEIDTMQAFHDLFSKLNRLSDIDV